MDGTNTVAIYVVVIIIIGPTIGYHAFRGSMGGGPERIYVVHTQNNYNDHDSFVEYTKLTLTE